MRVPLRFQITEFDCGTVSLQNAISYLYTRETVPAELVRAISLYSFGCYDNLGNKLNSVNCNNNISLMTQWFCDYVNSHDFGLNCRRYEKANVTIYAMQYAIDRGGCVFLKSYLKDEEFIILTSMDENYVYLWDPYYLEMDYFKDDDSVTIVTDKPFDYNRRVSKERFCSFISNAYALGPMQKRDCVVIFK